MRVGLVFTLMLLAASSALAQEAGEVRSPEYGLRYRVPDGWLPVLPAELDALNAKAAEASAGSGVAPVQFVLGFTRVAGGRLQLPYVLLALQPGGVEQLPVDEVAARFGAVGEPLRAPAGAQTFSALEARGPLLDVDKMRVLSGHRASGEGQARRVISATLLGKDRLLGVHCNVAVDAFDEALPRCVEFIDGVSLDPEKVWTPIGGTGAFVGVARTALQVGLLGGSLTLGLAVFLMRRRRQRQEAAARADAAPGD